MGACLPFDDRSEPGYFVFQAVNAIVELDDKRAAHCAIFSHHGVRLSKYRTRNHTEGRGAVTGPAPSLTQGEAREILYLLAA
jgi:hypothetical protein